MLDLLDYRRRVAEMYRFIRAEGTASPGAFAHFRRARDDLFRDHPQSPLDEGQKAAFAGLRYFDYDPDYRLTALLDTAVESRVYHIELKEGPFAIQQFARLSFELPTGSGTLALFWIAAYGGGLFLPFRDATNGRQTYGGGRYLYDTVKGADLGTCFRQAKRGTGVGRITLDFNYAYHPSCCYNPHWVCPLAPPQNVLDFPIPTGERLTESIGVSALQRLVSERNS